MLLCLLPLASLLGTGPTEDVAADPATDTPAIEDLDWMSGRWTIEHDGQYIEETWGPAREDAIVGSLRWARQGEVWLYGLMSIEQDDEHGLVFRLRHFNRELEPWDSEKEGPLTYPVIELSDKRVVFENPERDEPRRFIYEREDDTLTASLEGPDGGEPHAFRFTLDG